MLRTHLHRVAASVITRALQASPSLEQFTTAHAARRRLHIVLRGLTRRGVGIETVYDIGAHRGGWTEAARASLPGARFFLFEANAAHAYALERTGERFFITLLSSEEELVDFFASGSPGDSYYRELTDEYAGVVPEQRSTTTLDRIVAEHDLPPPDLIKADVQGAELDVLQGGPQALGHAKLVLLECPLASYNLGAPTVDEYLRFMDDWGFTVLEFVQPHWRLGQMVQVDVLFARIAALGGRIP